MSKVKDAEAGTPDVEEKPAGESAGESGAGEAGEGEAGETPARSKGLLSDEGGGSDESSDQEIAAGAPEEYEDFTLPEGVSADEGMIEQAQSLFKDLNLSQDAAQQVIDLYAGNVKAQQEAGLAMIADWEKQCRNDPEFGGKDFDRNREAARNAIRNSGLVDPEPFIELMERYGLTSHPEVFRLFHRAAQRTSEDTVGTVKPTQTPTRQEFLASVYTDMDESAINPS